MNHVCQLMFVCRGVGKTWIQGINSLGGLDHNRIHQGIFLINVVFLGVNAKKKKKNTFSLIREGKDKCNQAKL